MKRVKSWKKVIAFGLFAVLLGGLGALISREDIANRDYISYWAAGQQLAHGANPWDVPAVTTLEKGAGLKGDRPFIMRNPPDALFLALPLGYVSAQTGAILWELAIMASIMASIRMLWAMHGKPEGRLHLLGYLFAPVLACLMAGQTAAFLLLGITVFLYLRKTWDAVAGAALVVCAIKPHLFGPLFICVLFWSVTNREWRIIAGFALAVSYLTAIWPAFRPSIWSDYFTMIGTAGIEREFIPNASALFRLAVHPSSGWLQLVPACIACLWAVWYFLRHRAEWDWETHGSLVLIVSILAAPYSWFTDEAILLPAILAGVFSLARRGASLTAYGVIAGIALIEVLFGATMPSGAYIWTPIAWLWWYLLASRHPLPSSSHR